MGFAFCSIVIVKQMYYLHNTDLGFAFKDRGNVVEYNIADVLYDKMQQMPEITELARCHAPLLPDRFAGFGVGVRQWDEQPENAKGFSADIRFLPKQALTYYDVKVIEGEMFNDEDPRSVVLINESMAKLLGWHKSVGKSFSSNSGMLRTGTVKGVIKNIYSLAPTIPANPTVYCNHRSDWPLNTIMFKYKTGEWKTCKEKIEAIIKAESPGSTPIILNLEEEYDKFLKSENTMLQILTLVSMICVIVCVFGFVSMVALTCEERRKEIAIRKIHGATIKDILDIFFKEYLTLLIVGALIAFPVGYIIMKRWLEEYVVQTEISVWIYAAILLTLIMAIVLCVGRKVYKTSRENPAETVKKF
jgi:ABC-type antimicrobial peptide transport system permease subunit